MDRFADFMRQYVTLTPQEWEMIEDALELTVFQKGEIISKIDDIHRHIYFITDGLARAYTIDTEGKDYTWSIFFNDPNAHVVNLFMVDYDSFTTRQPSRLEIEALEECHALAISYEDHQRLSQISENILAFCKAMSDFAYCHLHHRVLDHQSLSAKERFERFIEQTPYLMDKVPQYQIASYLGITPIHLSRLKRVWQTNTCK